MTAAQIYSLIQEVPPVLEDWDFREDPQGHELLTCVRLVIDQHRASQRYKKLSDRQRMALRRRVDLAAMRLIDLIEYFDDDNDLEPYERTMLATANELFTAIGQQLGMDPQQLQAYCESKDILDLLDA